VEDYISESNSDMSDSENSSGEKSDVYTSEISSDCKAVLKKELRIMYLPQKQVYSIEKEQLPTYT